jgi:DNA-binding transcriptional MerR regulator
MQNSSTNLLTIGSFARATQLSLKALRLYAELGLLSPTWIDPASGYRYYHRDQVPTGRLMRMLREIDMPLATIRQVLNAPPGMAEPLVRAYSQALQERLLQLQRVIPQVVCHLREETSMTFPIQIRTVDEQPIVSMTKAVTVEQIGEHIASSLGQLYEVVGMQQGQVIGPPFGIYHGPINETDTGPLEVCVPVDRLLVTTSLVQARALAAGQVASVMLADEQCAFPLILEAYDALCDWIEREGFEAAEPPREIWHSMPGEPAREEIVWPFRSVK